ncbi:MAG: hypothetical protein A2004_05030 [Spirochaetes bacterium GWC1_61_12]|nr:MAG: hypothetical protein A2004_05030 [Spirochaetes bacterium GWC1_61_12]OHD58536.1 MAG: hypothetical protein A2Y32_08700 [Spirochaetes bacterium GWF1_60_12]HAP43960.1 hypothetical protein [Spirochaetaceae bacterium]HAW87268.1 hypothetical protein [Spirochaetaceae bacterium]HAX38616.1 hypothetical protein [Spirochaetaceae bacterium]
MTAAHRPTAPQPCRPRLAALAMARLATVLAVVGWLILPPPNLSAQDSPTLPPSATATIEAVAVSADPAAAGAPAASDTPTASSAADTEGTIVPASAPVTVDPPAATPALRLSPVTFFSNLKSLLVDTNLLSRVLNVVLTILSGIVLISLVISILKRVAHKRLDPRSRGLIIKVIQYVGIALIVINAFKAAQVDLSPLLGAAGIVGIALGFAAQTSVSNFISGFFLISEKAFTIGDVLNIDGAVGVVFSIDTLSIKLRAFDNRFIRIPNETLIKASIVNLTRFPVRRMNFVVTVPYDTNIEQARSALLDVADRHPSVLRNPEPFFMVQSFTKDGIELFLGVWYEQIDWDMTNNGMYFGIKQAFDAAGIRFAYPSVNLRYPAEASALPPDGTAEAGRPPATALPPIRASKLAAASKPARAKAARAKPPARAQPKRPA